MASVADDVHFTEQDNQVVFESLVEGKRTRSLVDDIRLIVESDNAFRVVVVPELTAILQARASGQTCGTLSLQITASTGHGRRRKGWRVRGLRRSHGPGRR